MGARICHKFLGAGTALLFLLCGLSISGVRVGAAGVDRRLSPSRNNLIIKIAMVCSETKSSFKEKYLISEK